MRQVFVSRSGEIRVGDAPAPGCGPGEVAIDVAFSVVSTGTETQALAGRDVGARAQRALRLARLGAARLRTRGLSEVLRKARVREGIAAPTGYSVAGTVTAAGEDAGDLEPGMRVAAGGSAYAHHAERVAVPRNLVAPLPASVSLRAGAFATVGAIALQGVRQARAQVGETALVVGLGLVGQLCAQILTASGCRVVGADPRPDRKELARRTGALVSGCGAAAGEIERVVEAATGGIGADAVLLCAGTESSEPVNTALRTVRQRGRVVIVGAVGMELERAPFYEKEVELTISCSYGPGRYDPTYEEGGLDYPVGFVRWTENRNLAAFLDLVARGRVDVDALVAGEHALEDAPKAFEAARAGAGPGVAHVLRYPARSGAPARTIARVAPVARASGAIGVAVIGAGGFANETLLPVIAATEGLALRAVVTRGSASAARTAEEFGAERASTDAGEILADPSVDAVVIATRHDLHAPLALDALAAGKHVFVEKPMGIGRDEIDALRERARTAGRVFTVGYNRRYAPVARAAKDVLEATPGPCALVYRVNAGPVPDGHWTLDPRVGGGRIVGEACHMLDLIAFWLGPDVLECQAVALSPARPGASPQDVAVSLRLRDARGETHLASLVYTSLGAPGLAKERMEVHARGGSFEVVDFESLALHGLSGRPLRLRRPDKGHRAEIAAFRDAVRGAPSPLLGVEEAWRAADLALRVDTEVRRSGQRA